MKKLNKTEKVIRWASKGKVRNVGHMMVELEMSEEQLVKHLSRLRRRGYINFHKVGKRVAFTLTQRAYYNRRLLVV